MMMWTEFDPVSGRIRQVIVGVQLTQPAPSPSLGVLDGVYGQKLTEYVLAGQLTARPSTSISAVQAASVVTLSGVAVGTVVTIGGDAASTITQDAGDGGLQLTFGTAGHYTVSAEQFPELPFNLDVTI